MLEPMHMTSVPRRIAGGILLVSNWTDSTGGSLYGIRYSKDDKRQMKSMKLVVWIIC